VPFKLYKLDLASMQLTELVKSGIHDGMDTGTGGLQVGPDLWAASYRSDRIIRWRARQIRGTRTVKRPSPPRATALALRAQPIEGTWASVQAEPNMKFADARSR
jgi:hypothetical protein